MATWVWTLTFPDASTSTITEQVLHASVKRRRRLWNDVKSCGDRLDWDMLWNSAVYNKIMATGGDIIVTVTVDGAAYFKGILLPDLSLRMDSRPDRYSCVATDMGQRLRQKIDSFLVWTAYKVCDTVTPAASILHQLCYAAGFVVGDMNVTTIDKTIDYFSVDDPERTYWDVLSDLLYEFGYVIYFGADGKVNVFDCFPSTATSTHTFSSGVSGDLLGSLETKRTDRTYEDVEVDWTEHETLYDQIIFSETQGGNGANNCLIPVAASAYYPTSSNVQSTFMEFSHPNGEIVGALNAALESILDPGISVQTFTASARRAQISLYNGGSGQAWIRRLNVRAGSVILSTTIHKTRQATNSKKLLTVDAPHITAAADATRLSAGLYRHYYYAPYTYRFQTRVSDHGIGSIVTLTESAFLGMSNLCIVVEVVDSPFTSIYEYTLEGLAAYSATSVATVNRDIPAPVAGVARNVLTGSIAARALDFAADVYAGDHPLPDGVELFDLTQLDCLSSFGRSPSATPVVTAEPPLISGTINPRLKRWSKNKLDHSACDDPNNAPHMTGVKTDALSSCTFALAADPVTGEPDCYKVTKTIAAGTYAVVYLDDYATGVIAPAAAGETWTLSAEIYVPTASGIEVSEIGLYGDDYYSGSWHAASAAPTTKDGWHRVSKTFIWNGSATGVGLYIYVSSNAALNEYFFIKKVQYEKAAAASEYESAEVAQRGAIGVWKTTTNTVDHATCGESSAPHVTGVTPTSPANGTFATDSTRTALDGASCFRLTKTGIAGSEADAYVSDNTGLNGIAAGETWTLSAEVYIPAGAAIAGNIYAYLDDYVASWQRTSGTAASLYDTWHRISVTRTMRASITATRAYIDIEPGDATNSYILIRNVQLEKSGYATAFNPATRAAGSLPYNFSWPDSFKIEAWVRPHFALTPSTAKYVISDDDGTDRHLELYYGTDDKWHARVGDGTNYVGEKSDSAYTGTSHRAWIHLIAYGSFSGETVNLIVNGVAQTTADSSGSVGTATPNSVSRIGGWSSATYEFDGLITDLAIWPTADTSTTHYTAGRPYFPPEEIANSERTVRIGYFGVRLNNVGITITDRYNRLMRISNADGMLAMDAAGNVIHDIQNGLVISNQKQLGHGSWLDDDSYIAAYTDVTSTGIKNISLSGKIGNSTNIRGALLFATLHSEITEVTSGARSSSQALYSNSEYNDSTLKTKIAELYHLGGAIASGTHATEITTSAFCWVPIFWSSGTPYLSLYFYSSVTSGAYIDMNIYLVGVST